MYSRHRTLVQSALKCTEDLLSALSLKEYTKTVFCTENVLNRTAGKENTFMSTTQIHAYHRVGAVRRRTLCM